MPVSFLVSLFKARPSPFYILDEVEAALDDTNLATGDHVVVFVPNKRMVREVERLFQVSAMFMF